MKLHHHLVAVGLALGLAACASQYTESETPKNLVLDDASAAIDVRFAPGSNRLLAGDAARLRALVARGAISQSDRVTVLAGGPPDLAAARSSCRPLPGSPTSPPRQSRQPDPAPPAPVPPAVNHESSSMRAAAASSAAPAAAKKAEGEGVVAVLQDQPTLDRVQGIIRELQLEDELNLEPTLDAALRRIREGGNPRVLILDLSDSTAPIAELSAARSVGGLDLKILALGTVNDVSLFRDLVAGGAADYLVKPVRRGAVAGRLEERSTTTSGGGAGLGQVIAFIGSRGGVGTTTSAVAFAWLMAEQ